jgi:hypothetical protein
MRDFKHTMDLLVKAYLNDTLIHGNCAACAVGNMIADSMNYSFKREKATGLPDGLSWREAYPVWDDVFVTAWGSQDIDKSKYYDRSKEQIDSTGYSMEELARIEYAFEKANKGKTVDDYMFNGLLAVLEVLADIHGVDFSGYVEYERQLADIHATK